MPDYIYESRAVAFLDVLGFKEKLDEFEAEAIGIFERERNGEVGNDEIYQALISPKANSFIDAFMGAISGLDPNKFKYYLFSDNICITVNDAKNRELLRELLLVICELYFAFAKNGYFLRGAIDYGYFINQETLALGKPLARAYGLEQKEAIYPRVLISEKFKEVFVDFAIETGEHRFNESLILQSCEKIYLNIFIYVLKTDNKLEFLTLMHDAIIQNLELNNRSEHVFIKYEWLAKEFNHFLNFYLTKLVYEDVTAEPSPEFLHDLELLKILNHGIED